MTSKSHDLTLEVFEKATPQADMADSLDTILDDMSLFQSSDDGDDYLNIFDKRIDKILKKQAEEDSQVSLMARDIYYRELSEIPLLTKEEEFALGKIAIEGDEEARKQALDKLVTHNLRLAGFVAKKYAMRGIEYDDLVGEGNLGIIKAAERYDYTKGFRFATYAIHWIRKSVVRYLASQGHPISLPEKGHRDVAAIRRAIDAYASENNDVLPSIAQLAKMLGETEARIMDIMRASTIPLSMDTPDPDKKNATIQDSIPDMSSITPYASVERDELYKTIHAALGTLSEKERHVIELHFGMIDGKPRPLEEIGKEFGLSRVRIHQIEKKSQVKMLESQFGNAMREFRS